MIAVLCLLIGCAGDPPRSTTGLYTVRKGDTVYSIAWRHGVDYRELARWNGIDRSFAIYPGQVLRLTPRNQAPTVTRQPRVAPSSSVRWAWPLLDGSATLTARPNGGKGLTMGGSLGQEIRAAAGGRIVYAGSGLLGYGQLVIVKHDDVFLSAYGHTQSILVREGAEVRSGQPIATMGSGPNGTPMLYFEIRRHGEPVDPTALLPKR
jgi:lipoprotein NlpD